LDDHASSTTLVIRSTEYTADTDIAVGVLDTSVWSKACSPSELGIALLSELGVRRNSRRDTLDDNFACVLAIVVEDNGCSSLSDGTYFGIGIST
jgi:hypothetical protein